VVGCGVLPVGVDWEAGAVSVWLPAGAAIHVGSAGTEVAGVLLVVPGAFDDVDPEDLQVTGWTTFTDPELRDAGPLAARAALLATPLHDPAWRSIEAERSAARRLLAWRAAATGWRAARPGQVSAAHAAQVAQFDAALDEGLDTRRALALLDAVADDPRLSPGDKLATFEAFDTILGLALTDPDPPDDGDAWRWAQARPARPTRRPVWLGPPGDLLPGLAPVQLILARTVDTLVVVTNVRAYPTGVAFTVRLRLRTPVAGRPDDWMDRTDDLPFSFDSSDPGQVLRLWVEDAEGRRSGDPDPEVDPMAEQAPRQPLLQVRGGGGSETDWDAESWPLPLPGPLTFACAWPARGIPETRVALDVEPVLRAAGEAVPLFSGAG
jgi:hypothetical protein